jgi:aconitate hydratase
MAQKILAQRASDPSAPLDSHSRRTVEVAVDQVALTTSVPGILGQARAAGLKKTPCEVAVAYDAYPVELASDPQARAFPEGAAAALSHGLVVSRAGMGFAPQVHVERFAAPARVCVTDSARMSTVGGLGMLSFALSAAEVADALATGKATIPVPVSVAVMLTGRLRPFASARDVALELVRRGLGDVVKRAHEKHRAPVVIELGGAGLRWLSASERTQIAQVAPDVRAAAALFPSDERTETYLRDQRRSKAHRALVLDQGADLAEVMSLDLGAVDPLVRDENGVVRTVRDVAGKPIPTVLVGGDGGVTLRDMLACAALLKSKRVHERTSFVVAPPSRQILEVASRTGALADLVSAGARLCEPDARVLDGRFYPGAQLRTSNADPSVKGVFVASVETCAFAVTHGEIGDPRGFKRPVRVTVPRELPTDDVLIIRKDRAK